MSQSQITRTRQFNRAVAIEIGALDDSFLSRGRPLGAARVLNAIGLGHQNVAHIRAYLSLDTGLLSRLLRSLEKEGLIRTTQNPSDGRGRISTLTAKGQQEFETYEALSDQRADLILTRHKSSTRLLEAMDVVTFAFSRDQIEFQEVDYNSDAARFCLNAFAFELAERLQTGFDLENSGDPELSNMKHPHGTFLVAMLEDRPIGCVGVKGQGGAIAEIKRMWITPTARGLGLARRMMTAAEDAARRLSISTLRLDTNSTLHEAVQLYQNTGWEQIDRFNDDPYPDLFYEKHLAP